jgi:hypothetical protein
MARGHLPSSKIIGFSGYVKWQGFDPVKSPNVLSHHPSIVSNSSINCVKYACINIFSDLLCIYMCFLNVPQVIDPIIWLEETLIHFGA